MFERFTERARRCIFFASQWASHYGSESIETEHLLLGILQEDPDVIGRFLPSKTNKDIRDEVEKHLTVKQRATTIEAGLSIPSKRSLAYAAEEAERLLHRRISIGHLLIGAVREEGGMTSQILRSAGLDIADMRQKLRETGIE